MIVGRLQAKVTNHRLCEYLRKNLNFCNRFSVYSRFNTCAVPIKTSIARFQLATLKFANAFATLAYTFSLQHQFRTSATHDFSSMLIVRYARDDSVECRQVASGGTVYWKMTNIFTEMKCQKGDCPRRRIGMISFFSWHA